MGIEKTAVFGLAFAGALALGGAARADEWDVGDDTDNGGATDNVLLHGSEQIHDLAVVGGLADQDWYLTANRSFSSYSAVIDGMTGDLDLSSVDMQRLDVAGTVVLESALVSDFGGTLSLNWLVGEVASPPLANFVRVQGAACGTNCNGSDRYRMRFYETTYAIPRFNNSGTQATVLLVQNVTDRACTIVYYFIGASGSLISASASVITPRELEISPTAVSAPSQSGSVRIAHTCGYGGLAGKAVSVEPSTGFAFDTLMVHRPH